MKKILITILTALSISINSYCADANIKVDQDEKELFVLFYSIIAEIQSTDKTKSKQDFESEMLKIRLKKHTDLDRSYNELITFLIKSANEASAKLKVNSGTLIFREFKYSFGVLHHNYGNNPEDFANLTEPLEQIIISTILNMSNKIGKKIETEAKLNDLKTKIIDERSHDKFHNELINLLIMTSKEVGKEIGTLTGAILFKTLLSEIKASKKN